MRIHGTGVPVFRDDPRWAELLPRFDEGMQQRTDLRAVITVRAERISDTCGFAVPFSPEFWTTESLLDAAVAWGNDSRPPQPGSASAARTSKVES